MDLTLWILILEVCIGGIWLLASSVLLIAAWLSQSYAHDYAAKGRTTVSDSLVGMSCLLALCGVFIFLFPPVYLLGEYING